MLTLSSEDVRRIVELELKGRRHALVEKTGQMNRQYGVSFADFEKRTLSSKQESCPEWDDYLEWKAFESELADIERDLEEIRNGRLSLA